jgi:hypothetical protein
VQVTIDSSGNAKDHRSRITKLSRQRNPNLYNDAIRMDSILQIRATNYQLFQNEAWRNETSLKT